jgi:hypothetical protein
LSRVFKPSTRFKLVSRVENAVRVDAVRGLEPRAPELESPRLLDAGVGARLNLAFELNICPECGWRLVEHNGLLVCEGCGLVLAPVYEPPKFKPADSSFNGFNGAPHISSGGLAQRALEALAGELGVPTGAVLEVYKRLKRAGGNGAAVSWSRSGGRFHPLPYPALAGRPPLVRGGIVGGEEKRNGTTPGPGFRVYKIRVNKVNKDRLKVLYNDVIYKRNGNIQKGLVYYLEEWVEMFENVKRMREEAGKRTLPKAPPLPLLVRFAMPDGSMRGKKDAACVIDLRKGELRIPSYGVVQKLRRSLVEALIRENLLEPRPDFVLQVTRKGFLRLIASRYVRASIALPLRIIAIDENSLNGEALGVWDVLRADRVVRSRYEELMPRNRGFLDRTAALFQSAAAGNPEALEEVVKLFHEAERDETELALLLTPERLTEIAASTHEKEKRLNRVFAEELTALVRKLIREAKARGWSVAIVIDPIDSESLKGSKLQRTLLKPRRLLRNLALYEGARFKLYRVSGKQCPMCGEWGIEVAHRRYRCPHCNIEWDRDKCATFWLAKRFLDEHFKEESSDETFIDIAGWLNQHPRGLL